MVDCSNNITAGRYRTLQDWQIVVRGGRGLFPRRGAVPKGSEVVVTSIHDGCGRVLVGFTGLGCSDMVPVEKVKKQAEPISEEDN